MHGFGLSLPEAWAKLPNKIEAPTSQQQQRRLLKAAKLAKHQGEESLPTKAAALVNIAELDRVKAPLRGPAHQSEAHKMGLLAGRALAGEA